MILLLSSFLFGWNNISKSSREWTICGWYSYEWMMPYVRLEATTEKESKHIAHGQTRCASCEVVKLCDKWLIYSQIGIAYAWGVDEQHFQADHFTVLWMFISVDIQNSDISGSMKKTTNRLSLHMLNWLVSIWYRTFKSMRGTIDLFQMLHTNVYIWSNWCQFQGISYRDKIISSILFLCSQIGWIKSS